MRTRACLSFFCVLFLLAAMPALAQASWGSIAINPETGHYGLSAGKASAAAAKLAAKNRCGDPHCKSALWVFNGWGAVVLKKNGVYISGIGRTKAKAFANARKRAREQAPAFASVFSGFS
ncbi:MAG TPA: DUF4189 domain-containing protein [Solirubrobacterales bacterium]|nr:DUF4189 domain-containing protein [Solirubrobacterales bacterium]